MSSSTSFGRPPWSRMGMWLLGHSARFLRRPMTALINGHLEGGFNNPTNTGIPKWSRTPFSAVSASGCRLVRWRNPHTAGSVISSRSPACVMVRTSASIPPTWHTTCYKKRVTHTVKKTILTVKNNLRINRKQYTLYYQSLSRFIFQTHTF